MKQKGILENFQITEDLNITKPKETEKEEILEEFIKKHVNDEFPLEEIEKYKNLLKESEETEKWVNQNVKDENIEMFLKYENGNYWVKTIVKQSEFCTRDCFKAMCRVELREKLEERIFNTQIFCKNLLGKYDVFSFCLRLLFPFSPRSFLLCRRWEYDNGKNGDDGFTFFVKSLNVEELLPESKSYVRAKVEVIRKFERISERNTKATFIASYSLGGYIPQWAVVLLLKKSISKGMENIKQVMKIIKEEEIKREYYQRVIDGDYVDIEIIVEEKEESKRM